MSLPHAMLGFLQRFPMTGYDLKNRCFDVSVVNFWPADQAQIYRELDRMEKRGWVACQTEVQQDRPNRKVYQLTATGDAELRRWLGTPQPLPIHREPFLVQLYFAAQLSNETILRLLRGQLAAHEGQLDAYQGMSVAATADRDATLATLTLELGIRSEHMYVAWLRETILRVEQMRETPGNV